MTFEQLKNTTRALLTGDNKLPDGPMLLSTVDYALTTVATLADSLHLLTTKPSKKILRMGHGNYFIRKPIPPTQDTDIIDIDEELCFAVARFIASVFSKDKGAVHTSLMQRLILDYNSKAWEVIRQEKREAEEPLHTANTKIAFYL